MGVRRVALGLVFASTTAHAVAPRPPSAPQAPRPIVADVLTALPAAGVARPLRLQPRLRALAAPPASWHAFVAAAGGSWDAAWDVATGVPSRIWGSGIAVPGANASADVAERAARAVLAAHVALLAPGSSASDFELVSNSSDGDIRSVGFVQRAGGRRVLGGQVSFRFKRDRLFLIGSEALPDVPAVATGTRATTVALRDRASVSLRATLGITTAIASAPGDEVVLPLVGDDAVLGYRVAAPLELDGGGDGRFAAFVDPSSGDVLAVRQLNQYATGTVLYHTVKRYPGQGYVDRPAPRCYVQLDGAQATTSVAGDLAWAPDVPKTLTTAAVGDLVTVTNKAGMGTAATTQLAIAPGGTAVWDASATPEDDAQVNAYITVNIVKEYVRARVDPNMPTLDGSLPVKVNINQECNAFFDGKSLNFFHATPSDSTAKTKCQNTALVQDVGFHEFGHALHTAEIIPGVGAFDGAMSEGAADFLAASITGDPGMGRGFFFDSTPIRDLDPPDSEAMWPADIGEIHHTGLIYGGTFWDLRKALVDQYGDAGITLVNQLYLGTLRRATGIATSLHEALASDDDDGNLANGTPHECQIRAAFGRHGLRDYAGSVEAPGAVDFNALAIGVIVNVTGLSARCPNDNVASVKLAWLPGFTGVPARGTADTQPAGTNRFFGELPLGQDDSVFYQAQIAFADGAMLSLPDNIADKYYQLYQGHVVKLYCTDFETDPFANGWTTGGDPMPQFQWAVPATGATNPHAAFSGTHVIAEAPNASYPDSSYAFVKTPEIDIGQWSDVHLQYRRWLAVEDSHFDQARVTANDNRAWINYSQNMGDSSSYHHVDKEWRFHDVPLSPHFSGHKLVVGWDLRSDPGLHFAGWNLDDVCIVANTNSVCGDGVKTATEQCDNGPANADVADACRSDCRLPTCGDGIQDTGEECDGGAAGSPTCSKQCKSIVLHAGCCSTTGDGAGGAFALTAVVLGFVVVARRRRRAAR